MVKGTTFEFCGIAVVLAFLLSGCVVNVVTGAQTKSPDGGEVTTTLEDATTTTRTETETRVSNATDDTTPQGNGRIVVVGDSLTLGADRHGGLVPRLEELGWDVSFDAMEGRTTPQGVAVLEEMLDVNPDPQMVVVGLGTNDRDLPQDFRPLVERVVELTQGSRLLWMAIEWEQRSQLQDVLDEYEAAGHLIQIDFRPVMTAQPELVGFDGIHFTEEGYAARAETMMEAIGEP